MSGDMQVPRNIAMIPARMGSQRLPKKNLALLKGTPLIVHAIRKCKEAGIFDRIVVNSEHQSFGDIAAQEGVSFHARPAALASNSATSEDFVEEFLKTNPCERVFQVHSIAPLMTAAEVKSFVQAMADTDVDVMLSVVEDQLECLCNGAPVNFTFEEKTNSQDLAPVQKVSWSMTGWRSDVFLEAKAAGRCATYAGRIGCFAVNKMAGHVIKTSEDLRIAEALYDLIHGDVITAET